MEHSSLMTPKFSGSINNKRIKKCLRSVWSLKALKGQSYAPSDFSPMLTLRGFTNEKIEM